jgi:arsenite methyltransferase
MAIQSPAGLDTENLRQEIRDVYSLVARAPEGEFHFHRGPAYASSFLGYDAQELAALPEAATASFAGVGNPLAIDDLYEGETVLDVGSGAGMDLLLAAKRVGPRGRAIGVDMTAEMLQSARTSAEVCGLSHVELRAGDAQSLPVEDDSVDVVISNGVLNLTTDKRIAYSEIARVLKPGGRLLLADIALDKPLPESAAQDIDLWSG